MQGVVKKIVEDRGFGFIKRKDNGKSVFFHCSDVVNYDWPVPLESNVEFDLSETEKGPRAVQVHIDV